MSALAKEKSEISGTSEKTVNNSSVNSSADATNLQPRRGKAAVQHAAQLARDAEQKALERQHAKGKSTARERLDLLFDTGSFVEIGRFNGGDINNDVAGCAVITGFGEVYGRKVAVYAQDFSVRGGTLGKAEGEKICHLLDMAVELRVPVVAVIDSGGARIQEGVSALMQYGRIFKKNLRSKRLDSANLNYSRPLRWRRCVLPCVD